LPRRLAPAAAQAREVAPASVTGPKFA
jgi:hypothetical protein